MPVVVPTVATGEAALAYVVQPLRDVIAEIPPSWDQAIVESIASNGARALRR